MDIIFHHPFPISDVGTSGTSVRPRRMLDAFKSLGYTVEEVTGYARERGDRIRQIGRDLATGRQFAFAYAETHTMPTPLTEPHHLPTQPTLDSGFFATLKRHDIPLGLFYRDIHWRYDRALSHRAAPKHMAATLFHHLDWRNYKRLVDHLFLPSLKMATYLPSEWPSDRMSALPPGGEPNILQETRPGQETSTLKLLYVGGVTPPLYDLSPLFEALSALPGVELTLCCRPLDWQAVEARYAVPTNVKIVHRSGAELASLYGEADVFALLWAPYGYHSITMPLKVPEAISFGTPILTFAGSEAARFVVAERVGWAAADVAGAVSVLKGLCTDRQDLEATRSNVMRIRQDHTWDARAKQVASTLMESRS